MGFASGRVSFRRFELRGFSPGEPDEVAAKFAAQRFGEERSANADGTEVGWIGPAHLFQSEFEAADVVFGRFVFVQLRIDSMSAPSAIVRTYRAIEEHAMLEESGKEYLSRGEKKAARETAEARAAEEAKAGAFRKTAAHPLMIDLEKRRAYFGALSAGAADRLMSLLGRTLDVKVEPVDVGHAAFEVADRLSLVRALDDLTPWHLIEGEAEGESFGAPDRSLLGREFLSWLMHEVQREGGAVAIEPAGANLPSEVIVMLENSISLDCDFHVTGRAIVYGDSPATAPETRAALTQGKQPTKLGMVLCASGDQYALTLDGPKWQVGGLKMPDVDEIDLASRLEERFAHVVRASELLDAIFASFLRVRLGGEQKRALASLRQWAKGEPVLAGSSNDLRVAQ